MHWPDPNGQNVLHVAGDSQVGLPGSSRQHILEQIAVQLKPGSVVVSPSEHGDAPTGHMPTTSSVGSPPGAMQHSNAVGGGGGEGGGGDGGGGGGGVGGGVVMAVIGLIKKAMAK